MKNDRTSSTTNEIPERPVLVTGATGAQGGAVARALLRAGWPVRALTRRPDGEAARALRRAGAEIVVGDFSDTTRLVAAMDGTSAVFGVTNYWEHFGLEAVHGKNLVDAARCAKVEHLVLSTLPSSLALSGGELSVPHFEAKADVEAYARRSSVPTTFIHVAFYFENFIHFFPPTQVEPGVLGIGFPQGDTPLAGVSVEDVGPVVLRRFADRERFLGRVVGIVGDELRGDEYASGLSRALACPVRYRHVPRDVFAALSFEGAADLADMFDLNRRFTPSRAADVTLTRELHPDVISFGAWARAHGTRLAARLCA